jgi:hypothetical protein
MEQTLPICLTKWHSGGGGNFEDPHTVPDSDSGHQGSHLIRGAAANVLYLQWKRTSILGLPSEEDASPDGFDRPTGIMGRAGAAREGGDDTDPLSMELASDTPVSTVEPPEVAGEEPGTTATLPVVTVQDPPAR